MDIQVYEHTDGCTDKQRNVLSLNIPVHKAKKHLCLYLNVMEDIFPIQSLHLALEGTGNIIRELPDHTGDEPTLDIHMGGFMKDIKIQNDKYISLEMNLFIMYHVHHLSTEMERKFLQKCLKTLLK